MQVLRVIKVFLFLQTGEMCRTDTRVVFAASLNMFVDGGNTTFDGSIFHMLQSNVGCDSSAVRLMLHCRSRGWAFKSTFCRFETWAISFSPLCMSLSDETLKVGQSYLTRIYAIGNKTPHTEK